MKTAVTKKGYKVRCVTNGKMALKTIKYNLPGVGELKYEI